MSKKECTFAETIIHLVLLFGVGIYIGMSFNNDALAKENEIKLLTANLTEELKVYQGKLDNATARVANNSNVFDSLDGRFDYECIELSDVFLQNARNDKLKFYFKKKFLKRPRVFMMFRAVRFSLPADKLPIAADMKLSYSVRDENIFSDYFKYSVDIGGPAEYIGMIEACYIAFEEVRVVKP